MKAVNLSGKVGCFLILSNEKRNEVMYNVINEKQLAASRT